MILQFVFAAYNTGMLDAELIVVGTFNSQPEAALAKSVLEAAGIDAMIKSDTAGGMRPDFAATGAGVRVLVRQEDAAVASDVLAQPARRVPRRFRE